MRLSRRMIVLFIIISGAGWIYYSRTHDKIINHPPRSGPILAFGDSLTAGFGAPAGESYPDQLSRLIGRPVINRGRDGDTIADGAARLPLDVLAERPAIVIVLLGGNDLLQKKDLDESFEQLRGMIQRMQAEGIMVVVVGLKAVAPIGGLGGRYSRLARRTGCVWIPDILDGVLGRPSLMADSIHPNQKGYEIMARRIAGALQPYLK